MDEERRRISELLLCALGGRTLPYQPPQKTMVSKIAYFLELKLMNFLEWLEINSESVQAFKIAQEESIVNSLDTLWEIYCMLVHIWLCTSFYLLVLIEL